jgi:tetratricopeptide (TPR) repeat protein
VTRKEWGAAAGHYGKAWQKDPAQPELLALRGWVLLQAGRTREGERLLERARWLALGDEKKCYDLAELLVKLGRPAEARRQREVNLHLSLVGSWYLGNALDKVAGDVERRKDYGATADLEELALLTMIHRGFFFADDRSFVRAPHRVHFLRARGLWDSGKVEPALAELRLCQRLLPGNLSMPLFFVPALEKAGRQKEADEIFGRVFAAYDGPCRDHPRWAKGHNDLAWLSARCRRRLDEALTHAEKAVALEPARVGYLDTLAEVCFQRGDKEKAVGLMKTCRDKEPKNAFYARQLRRYEAGDPKADVPEQER